MCCILEEFTRSQNYQLNLNKSMFIGEISVVTEDCRGRFSIVEITAFQSDNIQSALHFSINMDLTIISKISYITVAINL